MLDSTQQLKNNYYEMIKNEMLDYKGMMKKINQLCYSYGKDFYQFTSGKIALKYIQNKKTETKASVIKVVQETYNNMSSKLKAIREKYIKQCFPLTNTVDPVELNLIAKELELMSVKELSDFYKDNILDSNKVRLFDIEVKKRKKSNNENSLSEATGLESLRESYKIEDEVTKYIDEKIKFLNSCCQFASSYFIYLNDNGIDLVNEIKPKMIPYNVIMNYVEGKSKYSIPSELNVEDSFKQYIEV